MGTCDCSSVYFLYEGQDFVHLRKGEVARGFDLSQTFYAYLRKYAKRAGLNGLKPHDLRHAAAKLRRNSGASIEDVSALLGHRSIDTTATYLACMEGEEDNGWKGVAAVTRPQSLYQSLC